MTIYTPFTYRVTSKTTGQHYYGARWAQNCHPDDLWTTYFTSSTKIKSLIEKHGKEDFIVEVRKIFPGNGQGAREWETKVLARLDVLKRTDWLNAHNFPAFTHTEETTQKRRLANLGSKNPMYGRHHTPESKRKLSIALKGRAGKPHTPESKQKLREAHMGKSLTEEHKNNIRLASKGRKVISKDQRLAISLANKNRPKSQCPHCLNFFAPQMITRWHRDKCRFIS